MNKTLFNVLLFTAGAAIGSLVTWKIMKVKCDREIQDEIEAFKEEWPRLMREGSREYQIRDSFDDREDDEFWNEYEDENEDDDEQYERLARRYNRSSDENGREGEGDDAQYINGPVVIKPEEFADGNYDHDCYALTYYADGVLADDWNVKKDIEETIGEDSLEHFDDYAEGVLHVRNERLKADYEIVKDPRRYSDVLAELPINSAYDH